MFRLSFALAALAFNASAAILTSTASISYVPFDGSTRNEIISTQNPAQVSVSLPDPGGNRSANVSGSASFGSASAIVATRSQVSPLQGLHAYIFGEASSGFTDTVTFDSQVAGLIYRYDWSHFRSGFASDFDFTLTVNGLSDVDRVGRFDVPLTSQSFDISVLVNALSVAVGGAGAFSGDSGSEFITTSITAVDANGLPITTPLVYSTESGHQYAFQNANFSGSAVPEPSTCLIIGSGLVVFWVYRRKWRR